MLVRIDRQIKPILDVKFAVNRTKMVPYGRFAYEQHRGNVLVVHSPADHRDHFQLSVRQLMQFVIADSVRTAVLCVKRLSQQLLHKLLV